MEPAPEKLPALSRTDIKDKCSGTSDRNCKSGLVWGSGRTEGGLTAGGQGVEEGFPKEVILELSPKGPVGVHQAGLVGRRARTS